MKSREEAAQTRTAIVDAASALLRRSGIAGTSLVDVMSAAGLTHGGFYKHFRSKDQAMTVMSQLVGGLLLSRAVALANPALSDKVLAVNKARLHAAHTRAGA